MTERVSSLYFGIDELPVGIALRRRINDAPNLDSNPKPGIAKVFFPNPQAATIWLLTLAQDEKSNICVIFKEVWHHIVDFFYHLAVYEQRARKGESLTMAANWYCKIASIREIAPRLSCEIPIYFTILFAYPEDSQKIFARFTRQLRGVTNLFMNAYLRLFLLKKGKQLLKFGLLQESDLLLCFDDFVDLQHSRYPELEATLHQSIQFFLPLIEKMLELFCDTSDSSKQHIKEKSLQWRNEIWYQTVNRFLHL